MLVFFISFYCYAEEEDNIIKANIEENISEENLEIKDESKVIEKKQEKIKIKIKNTKEINKTDTIILEGLNKITAKSYKYTVKIGDSMSFERLVITPLFCWRSSPEQVKENKALLSIKEISVDGQEEEIFYGWMFSSSISVSSMEHPMYDIRVVDCFKNNIENE